MVIDNNQKDKFMKKYIVKITFRKKLCCKGDFVLSLNIINLLHKSPMHILKFQVSFNY